MKKIHTLFAVFAIVMMPVWVMGVNLSVTTSTTSVSCNGLSNGTATATAKNGTSPYTYSWSTGGGTNSTATGLSAGTYTITVFDALGGTATKTAIVSQPNILLANVSVKNNVSCNGGNDGSVTASPSGGSNPYTYSWSPGGATKSTASALTLGTYTVSVTDNNGCNTTASIAITQPANALSAGVSITNISCNGLNNGSATVTPSGGTSPYTYLWNKSEGTNSTAGGLSASTYKITVTDNNGCTFVNASVVITQPTTLTGSASVAANVSCNGGNNGNASISPSGGTSPYTYSWSNGNTSSSTGAVLSAGTYSTTVTDNNGCSLTSSVTITQPASALSASTSVAANLTCNGINTGNATITPSGGTTAYTYFWSPGGVTKSTASTLSAGTYTATVTDKNGCTAAGIITITQPAALSVTETVTNITCHSANNGSIAVSTSGGISPYTYSWTRGEGTNSSISGLSPFAYKVTITDNNGCSIDTTITITQPNTLTCTASTTANISCYGASTGNAFASPSGGTSPYTYSWSNGSSTVSRSNPTGAVLAAGTYTVTVTDSNGCTTTAKTSITQPNVLSANLSISAYVSCNGQNNGSAMVSLSGGVSPYTYSWSNGNATNSTGAVLGAGTYTVTVRDSNGCSVTASAVITQPNVLFANAFIVANVSCDSGATGSAMANPSGGTSPYTYSWSPGGATKATASALSAGTYTVAVTDNDGCNATGSVTITQPTALSTGESITNLTCRNVYTGSITLTPSGGVSPYTYSWNRGEGTNSAISGLSAAAYRVTITDNNGCTLKPTITVTQPPLITNVVTVIANVSCYGTGGGDASISTSGGVSPYTYSWSNGITSDSTGAVLSAGTYTITITDNNNCSKTASAIITQPMLLRDSVITASTVNILCNGTSTGSAAVGVTGGTSPYTYSWNPNVSDTATATGLSAGTYSVTVSDSNRCSGTTSVTITQPTALTTTATVINEAHCNVSNGSAFATPSGGVSPYTYSWTNSSAALVSTSDTAEQILAVDSYTVTVTDANGCTATAGITITQAIFKLFPAITEATCNGDGDDGTINLSNVSGGTSPYVYSWSGGGTITNATITGLSAAVYTVSVTDANGCVATRTAAITHVAVLPVASVGANVTCNGSDNGQTKVSVTGGSSPYTYSWTDGSTASIANGLSAGTYTILVTDKNGCTGTSAATVTQPAALRDSMASIIYPTCAMPTGGATIGVKGGSSPYSYIWTPNVSTAASATGLAVRGYVVQVKDKNGCFNNLGFSITQPLILRDSIVKSATLNAVCTNGRAMVGVKYGIPPYTYSWSPAGGTNVTATGLAAGTYTVTVTDAGSCSVAASVIITQLNTQALSSAASVGVNLSCYGGTNGQAKVSVSGGSSPYTYSWSSIANSTYLATGLSAGTYTVTVRDNCGTSVTSSVTLTQPAAIRDSVATIDYPLCAGGTGSATIGVKGGVSPYRYAWSPNVSTTNSANGLSVRGYAVQVKDVNGCYNTINFSVSQPPVLRDSIVKSTIVNTCNGTNNGSAMVGVKYGISPYTYSWNPVGGTTATAAGLSAGTYTVTVNDAGGCNVRALVTITQPGVLATAASVSINVSCYGGSTGQAKTSVTGGSSPYTYTWSPVSSSTYTVSKLSAGTYTVTVNDKCGNSASASATITQPAVLFDSVASLTRSICGQATGSATVGATGGTSPYRYLWTPNVSTTNSASGLSARGYVVQVKDANGCYNNITVDITCSQPVTVSYQADAPMPAIESINLYPNPTTGQFTLSGLQTGMIIEMYDYIGKMISSITVTHQTMQLNITKANGFYFIRILDKDGNLVSQKKVVKTQ